MSTKKIINGDLNFYLLTFLKPLQVKYIKKIQKTYHLAMRSIGIKTRMSSHLSKIDYLSLKGPDGFENKDIESIWKLFCGFAKSNLNEKEQKILKMLILNQDFFWVQRIKLEKIVVVVNKVIRIMKTLKIKSRGLT